MIPAGDNYTIVALVALDPVVRSALGFLVAALETYEPPPLEAPHELPAQTPPP